MTNKLMKRCTSIQSFTLFTLVMWSVAVGTGGSLNAAPLPDVVMSNKVTVSGNKPEWTKITGVEASTLIKVHAEGTVDFGGHILTKRTQVDAADAGVEGNAIGKFFARIFGSDWQKEIENPAGYAGLVKEAFLRSEPVNFNEGGVWIKVVNRTTGDVVVPPTLYYYWERGLNTFGAMSDSPVDVYAKAHDGGKNADGDAKNFTDNTGNYIVWLELSKPPKVLWTLP